MKKQVSRNLTIQGECFTVGEAMFLLHSIFLTRTNSYVKWYWSDKQGKDPYLCDGVVEGIYHKKGGHHDGTGPTFIDQLKGNIPHIYNECLYTQSGPRLITLMIGQHLF